jgi:hypothetical protein
MALQHDQDQGLFSYLEDKKATKSMAPLALGAFDRDQTQGGS